MAIQWGLRSEDYDRGPGSASYGGGPGARYSASQTGYTMSAGGGISGVTPEAKYPSLNPKTQAPAPAAQQDIPKLGLMAESAPYYALTSPQTVAQGLGQFARGVMPTELLNQQLEAYRIGAIQRLVARLMGLA